MIDPDQKRYCPLLKKDIYWGGCYEVQEVRKDNLDMENFFDKFFDIEEANDICEKCRWCYVNEWNEQKPSTAGRWFFYALSMAEKGLFFILIFIYFMKNCPFPAGLKMAERCGAEWLRIQK